MRILFCGTYPGIISGYAKISASIVNFLVQYHDVYHVAFQAKDETQRYVDPRIKLIRESAFGYENILDHIREIKPDVVILYNDVIVCSHYINKILEIPKTFKLLIYLDLTYKGEKYLDHLNKLTDVFIGFNKAWEKYLIEYGIPTEKVTSIDHALSIDIPSSLTFESARKRWGISMDDFVVLNLNTNTYRKLLDVTIDGFIHFSFSVTKSTNAGLMFSTLYKCTENFTAVPIMKWISYFTNVSFKVQQRI